MRAVNDFQKALTASFLSIHNFSASLLFCVDQLAGKWTKRREQCFIWTQSCQQPSFWPQAHLSGHEHLRRGGCNPQYPRGMFYPLEFVPVMHVTGSLLSNTLAEPHIERNQNFEQDMIVHLSFFFTIHNSVRVVHPRFTDNAPRESWKLGTQILSTQIFLESLDIYGPSSY